MVHLTMISIKSQQSPRWQHSYTAAASRSRLARLLLDLDCCQLSGAAVCNTMSISSTEVCYPLTVSTAF